MLEWARSAVVTVAFGGALVCGTRDIAACEQSLRIQLVTALDDAALATWPATFEHAFVEPGAPLQGSS